MPSLPIGTVTFLFTDIAVVAVTVYHRGASFGGPEAS